MVEPDLARRIIMAARKGREWLDRRDDLIVEALKGGASQREVSKLAGLSQPSVHDIWHRSQRAEAD